MTSLLRIALDRDLVHAQCLPCNEWISHEIANHGDPIKIINHETTRRYPSSSVMSRRKTAPSLRMSWLLSRVLVTMESAWCGPQRIHGVWH